MFQMANVHSSLRLDLNGRTVLRSGPRNDHEVAAWQVVLSLHDLSDRADGVDNLGARLVRREFLQRLQGTTAIRIPGEREQTLPFLDRAACIEKDTSCLCDREQLFFVKFQHAARMLVGDLPLVAVLERERLESSAFLSTSRPLSVSSLVLLSRIRRKRHESVRGSPSLI